jgi:Protein of unknown function (DUF3131)./Uncharacterized protein conserved in bacteria (DUF2329).
MRTQGSARLSRWAVVPAVLALAAGAQPAVAAASATHHGRDGVASYSGLSPAQQRNLMGIARDSWKFFAADVDPTTHLPMDNLTFAAGSKTPTSFGRYTSSANIGVYIWSVVSAEDLGLISESKATKMLKETLGTVSTMQRFDGFLLQWYDTSTGDAILNPGDIKCSDEPTPKADNCTFLSNVDNGWYASGLIVARQALPGLRPLVKQLMAPMDFSIFYDNGPQTHCNVNPAIAGNQPTGQMFGGYYVGFPPNVADNETKYYYHNGALYSDPRISAYIGMGLHQMPGDVWWRSWRTLPPPAPFADCQSTDPDFSWQGQWPAVGQWQTQTDPQSGKQFPVWEGHYTYPGSDLSFIPTFGGGMFEGLMPNNVVPETSWGKTSFGLADARTAQVQIKYATEDKHYPVWGMSPSSTPDDSGDYATYGVEGQDFPYHGPGATADQPNQGLSLCRPDQPCASEGVVTPHASFLALDVTPQKAYANIQTLRKQFPGVYGSNGFFDAVNPTTGAVGHRILVLDQSMIMASLDNALRNRAMQRHFAADPVSWAAKEYLSAETMSLN